MATRIPINKDSYNFDDRQKKIWEDMERDMERRRREWEDEIDKMRKEFFHLHPQSSEFSLERPSSKLTSNSNPYAINSNDDGKPVLEKDEQGNPIFKVQFNMKGYKPEEVNVKMDSTKIMVSAKHEEKGSGSTVSREYNREVNIPCDVNPLSLQCSLNPDGNLVIHAPIPVPTYNAVKDSSSVSSTPPGQVKSSSHQTFSALSSSPVSSSGSSSTFQPNNTLQQHAISSSSKPSYLSGSTSSMFEENASHPDHIVPSFKPPPDLSRLDALESPPRLSASHHLNSLPSSTLQSSLFSRPSPFSSIHSNFMPSPVFPEPPSQVQLNTPIVTSHDGTFQLTLAINEFKPEELTVKTQDGKILICARREVNTGNRARTIEMTREHSLPDNVDPLTVKAFFTETNNLIVEAPFLKG